MNLLDQLKSDPSLLSAFTDGDASAFDTLYGRHKEVLFQYLIRQSGSTSLAEEVAQDVWLAVIRGAENYQPKSDFRCWLFGIAHKRLADAWRKLYRQPAGEHDQLHELEDIASASPETQRFEDELQGLLNQLPDEQRQTILLREQGFSYEEIAQIGHTGQETVKSRLRYARNNLRAMLDSAQT